MLPAILISATATLPTLILSPPPFPHLRCRLLLWNGSMHFRLCITLPTLILSPPPFTHLRGRLRLGNGSLHSRLCTWRPAPLIALRPCHWRETLPVLGTLLYNDALAALVVVMPVTQTSLAFSMRIAPARILTLIQWQRGR